MSHRKLKLNSLWGFHKNHGPLGFSGFFDFSRHKNKAHPSLRQCSKWKQHPSSMKSGIQLFLFKLVAFANNLRQESGLRQQSKDTHLNMWRLAKSTFEGQWSVRCCRASSWCICRVFDISPARTHEPYWDNLRLVFGFGQHLRLVPLMRANTQRYHIPDKYTVEPLT